MRLHCHGEIHLRWVKSLRDEICPWQMKSSLREGEGLPMPPSGREVARASVTEGASVTLALVFARVYRTLPQSPTAPASRCGSVTLGL